MSKAILIRKLSLLLFLSVLTAGGILAIANVHPALAAGSKPVFDSEYHVFTPISQYQHTPYRPLEWDGRLSERGAIFIPAQVTSGQGYWRLVKAVWYNEQESQGKHHIFIDTLDISGWRQPGVKLLIHWEDGSHTIYSEAKPSEPYAANFDMYAVAPAYNANPNTGAPTDGVNGMGLGDFQHPTWPIHTSYGLTWRWTIAP